MRVRTKKQVTELSIANRQNLLLNKNFRGLNSKDLQNFKYFQILNYSWFKKFSFDCLKLFNLEKKVGIF